MVQESVNEEIKWLEEQLEAKKKELAIGGVEKPEKEMVREVIKDVAAKKPQLLPTQSVLSDDAAKKAAYNLKEKEHQQIIEGLISLAFAQGLAIAVKAVNHLKNPHLLDEFHDALADKYYEKLLAARKLKI